MAFEDDFSVTVGGNIRHDSGATHYPVLQLHRYLQALADDPTAAGNDLLDMTNDTPSERSTDNIIKLLGTNNIDDDAAEYLYDGSVLQGSGETEVLYSGLKILGAVNNTDTQVQFLQDRALYDGAVPFWGDQSTGGYNGDVVTGVLLRCLVKSRIAGCDIDEKRIIVQARHWGDTFDFFKVQLGEGEAVAALGTTPDPQNNGTQGTVTAYTHVANVEGYQLIDIGDGNGDQPYYSKWTYGLDDEADQLKSVWEWAKDLTGNTTAKTIHGLNGEFFLGVTHSFDFDALATGPFIEDEVVVWGTNVTYKTLVSGPFTPGFYVRIGVLGAAGRVMDDNGSDELIIALEDTGITLVDSDVITEYDPSDGSASGTTAAIDTTILDNTKAGGSGVLLGLYDNDPTGSLFIQVVTGTAPVDNLPILGASDAYCLAEGTVVARTVPKVCFIGSFTGTLIGAYGLGIDPGDLTSSDTVEDLEGDTNTPPNNVTFTVSGLVSTEDYIMVGPKGAGDYFEWDQMATVGALDGPGVTTITVDSIPANTPQVANLRLTLQDGRRKLVPYLSWTGSVFTINSTDFTSPEDANSGNDIMITYIDVLCDAITEAYVTIYTTPQTLWVRARDGGAGKGDTPMKTHEGQASLSAAGGSAVVSRIDDY
jgi:hypothetical protein